jgi:hypothetical protein
LSEQNLSFRLRNSRKHRLNIYLEPWGEIHVLEPNKMVRIDAASLVSAAPDNMLEIESNDDSVTVWGWGGSSVTVRDL